MRAIVRGEVVCTKISSFSSIESPKVSCRYAYLYKIYIYHTCTTHTYNHTQHEASYNIHIYHLYLNYHPSSEMVTVTCDTNMYHVVISQNYFMTFYMYSREISTCTHHLSHLLSALISILFRFFTQPGPLLARGRHDVIDKERHCKHENTSEM